MMSPTEPLPLAGLHQFTDFALKQVALQRADVADVQFAIKVIGFMQKGARQQFLAGFFIPLSSLVLRPDSYSVRPRDLFAKIGNAEATFASGLLAFLVNDFRISQDEP